MGEKYFGEDVTNMTVRQINALFRRHDESHLFPINGEFNVTERAIKRLRKCMKTNGSFGGIEYAYALDQEIGNIVNMEG